MALLAAIKAIQQSTDETDVHAFGYQTARAGANATLVEWWNAATNAGRVAAIGKDGHLYSAVPLAAGALLYAVTGGIAGMRRMDALAIGTANQVLRVNAGATAPEWASTLSGLTLSSPAVTGNLTITGGALLVNRVGEAAAAEVWVSGDAGQSRVIRFRTGTALRWVIFGASGDAESGSDAGSNFTVTRYDDVGTIIDVPFTLARSSGLLTLTRGLTVSGVVLTASAGLTVASGQTLTVTGATITGLTAASVAAGTFPAGAFSIPTLAVTSGLTLTGATITGAPTWGSAQAITLSTAAQPNITSVGTLTSLAVGAITSTGLIQTTLTTQQLSLRYDASNHLAVTVASNGAVTYNATGSAARHLFSDPLRVPQVEINAASNNSGGTQDDVSTNLISHIDFGVSATITGFANGIQGKLIYLTGRAGVVVTLKSLDAGSQASNQIETPGAADYVVADGSGVVLIYLNSGSRWKVLGG